MNVHSRTITLYYISLSTEKSKLEHVRPVHYKMASETFFVGGKGLILLKKDIKFRVTFGTGLVVQLILFCIDFCPRDTVQWRFQNLYCSFVILAHPWKPKYSFILELNRPLYSRMFPSNANSILIVVLVVVILAVVVVFHYIPLYSIIFHYIPFPKKKSILRE